MLKSFDDYDDYDEPFEVEDDPLDPFIGSGQISEVLHTVKSGKEGTVYCCRAGLDTGMELLAAKVYRSREHRSFKNDSVYRAGRLMKQRDTRAMQKHTDWGREVAFGSWVEYEYQTLRALHSIGAKVPKPLTRSDNVILMEFVGDEEQAGQPLHSVRLESHEVRPIFELIMRNIELWLANNLIHADLSAYNVLYWRGNATIIDVPQAVDPRFNPQALLLLQRDVTNICEYFARYGIKTDPERITRHLWGRFVRSEL